MPVHDDGFGLETLMSVQLHAQCARNGHMGENIGRLEERNTLTFHS
jgi:hypothetical protein